MRLLHSITISFTCFSSRVTHVPPPHLYILPPSSPLPPLLLTKASAEVRRQLSISRLNSAMPSDEYYHHDHLHHRQPERFPVELVDDSDFDGIVNSDGLISICGFGSLLSEKSARSTFPDLINFRMAKLSGFRRIFAHVAPIFFERGIGKPETKEISSLSVEPCEGESLIVTIFEIQRSEIPSFIEREHEFKFLAVTPETLNGLIYTSPAILCARYSDEEYFRNRCKGNPEIFYERYGRYDIHKIWRDDILPCRIYLRHCVLAARNLGDMAYNNFLDHTFLGDRRTTIREYLDTTGAGIMVEEPPEPLKERYGG